MDLHYLEIFNTVAKFQSYKEASIKLRISQPALSTEIKKLEEQIGLRLFDRIGNRICLNSNGKMLQKYTIRIFSTVDELEQEIEQKRDYIGGSINIGASNTPATYILPKLMSEFADLYPKVRFNMIVGTTSEIADQISEGQIDLAVNGGNICYHNQICTERILNDRLLLVASPRNPVTKLKKACRNDLTGENFIVHKANSQLYTYYEKMIRQLDIPEKIGMSLGSIEAIKTAVIMNIGIALIPQVAIENELQEMTLCIIPIPLSDMDYPYSMIYNKNKALSASAYKFKEFVHARFD